MSAVNPLMPVPAGVRSLESRLTLAGAEPGLHISQESLKCPVTHQQLLLQPPPSSHRQFLLKSVSGGIVNIDYLIVTQAFFRLEEY